MNTIWKKIPDLWWDLACDGQGSTKQLTAGGFHSPLYELLGGKIPHSDIWGKSGIWKNSSSSQHQETSPCLPQNLKSLPLLLNISSWFSAVKLFGKEQWRGETLKVKSKEQKNNSPCCIFYICFWNSLSSICVCSLKACWGFISIFKSQLWFNQPSDLHYDNSSE